MKEQDNTESDITTAQPQKYAPLFFHKINKILKWTSNDQGGRNHLGRICVQHQGGRKLKRLSNVDIYRRINLIGEIVRVYTASNRTGFIGTILYINGIVCNIVITENVYMHTKLFTGSHVPKIYIQDKAQGWTVPVWNVRLFTVISNIEPIAYYGGRLATSAGVGGVLSAIKEDSYIIKLSSGWIVKISPHCLVSIGRTSNIQHKYRKLHNAGTARRLGIRPTVRGVAKNACDHPHGGGEGKGSPPRAQVSPWGKLTKGTPTTNKKYHRDHRRKYKQIIS